MNRRISSLSGNFSGQEIGDLDKIKRVVKLTGLSQTVIDISVNLDLS
jgi:hypothetical protein